MHEGHHGIFDKLTKKGGSHQHQDHDHHHGLMEGKGLKLISGVVVIAAIVAFIWWRVSFLRN